MLNQALLHGGLYHSFSRSFSWKRNYSLSWSRSRPLSGSLSECRSRRLGGTLNHGGSWSKGRDGRSTAWST